MTTRDSIRLRQETGSAVWTARARLHHGGRWSWTSCARTVAFMASLTAAQVFHAGVAVAAPEGVAPSIANGPQGAAPAATTLVGQATAPAAKPRASTRVYGVKDAEQELKNMGDVIKAGSEVSEFSVTRLEDFLNTQIPRVKCATPEEETRLRQVEADGAKMLKDQRVVIEQAVRVLTNELVRRAAVFMKLQQVEQAEAVYTGYQGGLKDTTANWRAEQVKRVREQKEAAKTYRDLIKVVAIELAKNNMAAAKLAANSAVGNPKLAGLSNDTAKIAAFVDRVGRYEDDILASYMTNRGVVSIALTSGKRVTGRIGSKTGNSFEVMVSIEGAEVGQRVHIGEISLNDCVKQLGSSCDATVCVQKAIMCCAGGNKAQARSALEKSPVDPLVAALAMAMQLDSTATRERKMVAIPDLPPELGLDLGGGETMELVLINPGSFTMGSEQGSVNERPAHQVTITAPFYMGRYEVTQRQWQQVMGNNPSKSIGTNLPVHRVSWTNCQTFLRKLKEQCATNEIVGECVLPTEAQWEYACRAGSSSAYYYGDEGGWIAQHAWVAPEAGAQVGAVGGKKPNEWGLYDMYGNVWEWCQDLMGEYWAGAVTDPLGPLFGASRVARGGSYNHNQTLCRSAARLSYNPSGFYDDGGFRVVVTPTPPKRKPKTHEPVEPPAPPVPPKPGEASKWKGRFYTFADDDATIYVNGTPVYAARSGLNYSDETTVGVGDLIHMVIRNNWGERVFAAAFLASDRSAIISFRSLDLKDMGSIQPIEDISATSVNAAVKKARRETYKGTKPSTLLPEGLKCRSDFVWGGDDNGVLATVITKSMVEERAGKRSPGN